MHILCLVWFDIHDEKSCFLDLWIWSLLLLLFLLVYPAVVFVYLIYIYTNKFIVWLPESNSKNKIPYNPTKYRAKLRKCRSSSAHGSSGLSSFSLGVIIKSTFHLRLLNVLAVLFYCEQTMICLSRCSYDFVNWYTSSLTFISIFLPVHS